MDKNISMLKGRIFKRLFLVLLFAIGSCKTPFIVTSSISSFNKDAVLLSKPICLYEFYGSTGDKDKFSKNLYIGSIQFSGGFIRNPESGMMVQSRDRSFGKQKEFEDYIKSSINESLIEILKEKNIIFKISDGIFAKRLVKLVRSEVREKHDEDGTDSINLPRYKYSAVDTDVSRMRFIKESDNIHYLMMPIIEYYYGHNGGWFNNQIYGCAAGVRMAIHIYVYDIRTGKPVFIFQDYKKKLYEYKFGMSVLEMKQELYGLEKEIFENLFDAIP